MDRGNLHFRSAGKALERIDMEDAPEKLSPSRVIVLPGLRSRLILTDKLSPMLIAVESVVPHLLEVERQDVLDRSTDELLGGHGLMLVYVVVR